MSSRLVWICLVYVPPGMSKSVQDEISTFVSDEIDTRLKIHPTSNVIVAGDFNDLSTLFLEEQFNLQNKVKMPTRGESFLDQIRLDDDLATSYAEDAIVGAPVKNSDHCTVFLHPNPKLSTKFVTRRSVRVWDFRESNLREYVDNLERTGSVSYTHLTLPTILLV